MSTTLVYHFSAGGITQYMDYPFTEMCTLSGVALGIKRDGLFQLDVGDTDDSVSIAGGFALPKTDFGSPKPKRLRSMYFSGSFTGDVNVTISSDSEHIEEYTMEVRPGAENLPKGFKVSCSRKRTRAVMFSFLVENKRGSYFCVNNISALIVMLR